MKTLRLVAIAATLAVAAACEGSITQSTDLAPSSVSADSTISDPYQGSPG